MDGFFVAKFKVEKRKKPVAATKEEEEAPQMKLNEEGELVEEKRTAFNDDEDEDIIKGMSPLYLVSDNANKNRGKEEASPQDKRYQARPKE
jgi:hypothetical protein